MLDTSPSILVPSVAFVQGLYLNLLHDLRIQWTVLRYSYILDFKGDASVSKVSIRLLRA